VRASPLDATTIVSPYSTPGTAVPGVAIGVNKKKDAAAINSGIFLYLAIWFVLNNL
jgi:hypothetical protein